jgi:ribosomal protein S18 acetylase RimI-like enzyme
VTTPQLPDGLTTRPLTQADAASVTALIAAQELADIGEVAIEEADIVADWQRPATDLAAGALGVFDGAQMVGYVEVRHGERGFAAVHPAYRGRGIGTELARWMQLRAASLGRRVIGMPVPQGSPGDRLLASLGYHVRWESWVLEVPEGASIPERGLPQGYAVRAAAEAEYPACFTVVEDAFLEWTERARETFDDWAALTVRRPGFEPWMLRVVTDPEDAVVGAALVLLADNGSEGYVDQLAVRADQRGRGLAQALLVDAFGEARARGARRSTLSTDSRTGALSLYEKVGMVVTSTWVNRAVAL